MSDAAGKLVADFGVLVTFLLAGGLVAGSAQSGQTLSTLTVPVAVLPNGCALTPLPAPSAVPVRGGLTFGSQSEYPTNPWTGTDRRAVAAIQRAIDAAPSKLLPDVPPTASRDAAAAERTWAASVLEAYHAAYTAVGGSQVDVVAVTFNDVTLATTSEPLSVMLNPRRDLSRRIVRGATVVRVSTFTSSACFGAVQRHIESFK